MTTDNTKGFSLIELMVALLIMSMVVMNITALVKNQNLASLRIQSEYDMTTTINAMGKILANSTECKQNIQQFTNTALVLAANSSTGATDLRNVGNKFYISSESLAKPIGNSRLSISSIILARPDTGNNVAKLSVNFIKKGTTSEIVTKSLDLNFTISTVTANEFASCNAIGFRDDVTAYGIKACPSTMAMIGTPGLRSTFCIDKASTSAATYEAAATACAGFTVTGYENLGSAHLCDFSEWNKACSLRTTYTDFAMSPDANSWEWISSAPTSTATSTTIRSNLLKIGAKYTHATDTSITTNPCITVDTGVLYDGTAKYRCCFH